MSWTVILKNTTTNIVNIRDLGFKLQPLEVVVITETFKYNRLAMSEDLKDLINDSTIVINNGSSDLNIEDGLNFLELDNLYHTKETYIPLTATNIITDHGNLLNRDAFDQHPILSITNLQQSLDLKENIANKSQDNGYASLDYRGKVPYAELPELAISTTHVVNNETEQLALSGITQEGDIAIRTDENKSYIRLDGFGDTMSDWQELLTPPDTVLSVNGETGVVILTQNHIGLSAVDNTADIDKPLSVPQQTYIDTQDTSLSGAIDDNSTDIVGLSGAIDTKIVQYWTETEDDTGVNVTVPATTWTPATTATDADAVIIPKGNGALLTTIPDGTLSGGNKRGNNAIDLQTVRSANTQVAAGDNSVIAGGSNNTASGNNTFIGSGENNIITNWWSGILAGKNNTIIGYSAAIGGGQNNTIDGTGVESFIGGGENNTASALFSVIGAGQYNTTNDMYSAIVAGDGNIANGNYSFVGAGRWNTASGDYSFVGNGYVYSSSNTASGLCSFVGNGTQNIASGGYSFVGNGRLCTASGANSFVGSGRGNKSNGDYSNIAGGYSNQTNGDYSAIVGGRNNNANNSFSTIVGGYDAKTRIYGQQSYASGRFVLNGDAQTSKLVLRTETTETTGASGIYTLTTDGLSAASTTNILTVNDKQTISFLGTIVVKTPTTDINPKKAAWKIEGIVDRDNTNNATVPSFTITEIYNTEDWYIDIVADNINKGLKINAVFPTVVGSPIRAVCTIDTSEVTF